jgi:hypothetical protein
MLGGYYILSKSNGKNILSKSNGKNILYQNLKKICNSFISNEKYCLKRMDFLCANFEGCMKS